MRHEYSCPTLSPCDKLSRKNLATHAILSILCASLSPSFAGLSLGRHLGPFGVFPLVAGNRPNTSICRFLICTTFNVNRLIYLLYRCCLSRRENCSNTQRPLVRAYAPTSHKLTCFSHVPSKSKGLVALGKFTADLNYMSIM